MVSCSIINCENKSSNQKGKNCRYFGFPKSEIKYKWLEVCKSNSINLATGKQ